jgi:lipoate-protein ligase A
MAQVEGLRKLVVDATYKTLLELGVKPEKLSFSRNDLLCNVKKFMGDEQRVENNVFTEAAIITLEYTPEKEIFKRLTGKYALSRGITGILEETQCFTKQQFIDKLLEKITTFMNTLD